MATITTPTEAVGSETAKALEAEHGAHNYLRFPWSSVRIPEHPDH